MTFSISFDVDGVLIDSKPLVERAYALAGVELDGSEWGRPWQSWMVARYGERAEELHALKNMHYRELLAEAKPTSATRLARFIGSELVIVSSASLLATRSVCNHFGLSPYPHWTYTEMIGVAKISLVNETRLIHIDDDQTIVRAVDYGVLYAGQPVEDLLMQITERMDERDGRSNLGRR